VPLGHLATAAERVSAETQTDSLRRRRRAANAPKPRLPSVSKARLHGPGTTCTLSIASTFPALPLSALLKEQNLVLLQRISGPSNGTATTKTRRTPSYTKELILYFFVILRALCVFVVVVAFLLGCGRCSRCVKTIIPLHAIPRRPKRHTPEKRLCLPMGMSCAVLIVAVVPVVIVVWCWTRTSCCTK